MLNLHTTLQGRHWYYPHFADQENKTPRVQELPPKTDSLYLAKPYVKPGILLTPYFILLIMTQLYHPYGDSCICLTVTVFTWIEIDFWGKCHAALMHGHEHGDWSSFAQTEAVYAHLTLTLNLILTISLTLPILRIAGNVNKENQRAYFLCQ